MSVKCEGCGVRFDAKRASRKWCSNRCRVRAQSGAKITPIAPKAAPALPAPVVGVLAATLAELVAAGQERSAAGQSALRLAERMDAGSNDTGSSYAALAREHAARVEAAVAVGHRAGDPLDELATRRAARVAGA